MIPISNGFSQKTAFRRELLLMGSRFEITAVSQDEKLANKSIDSAITEIQRIEKLISSWNPESETSRINKNAGIAPVPVSQELYKLIKRCVKVSQLTDGAFDITFASMSGLWKFDGGVQELPPEEKVRECLQNVGFEKIILDDENRTVFLKKKGMKIGFGAIGKGYAANRAQTVMKNMGIESGIVNAGGDLIVWGWDEKGHEWEIGVADPEDKKGVIAWLGVKDMAVVTSGDYEKYTMINGKRYSHIIDPRTGYPTTGLKSVTIFCPDAELADALATSVFVLGKEKGLALINQLNSIECLVIDENNKISTSVNLELNYYKTGSSKGHQLKIGG